MNGILSAIIGLLLIALFFSAGRAKGAEQVHPEKEGLDVQVYLTVTPKPKDEKYADIFYKTRSIALLADQSARDENMLKDFQAVMKKKVGLDITNNPPEIAEECDLVIRLKVGKTAEHSENAEGYALSIREKDGRVEAEITGKSLKGVQHGLQSMRQLIMKWKDGVIVRKADLLDWPSIPFRLVKRPFDFWLDQAVLYKMNGGTMPTSLVLEEQDKQAASMRSIIEAAKKRRLNMLVMVNMGNIYRGSEEAIRKSTVWFEKLYEIGFTHLAVMNDDKMTLADSEARKKFGGYYQAQLHYITKIDEALRKMGYRESLGFMSNEYQERKIDADLAEVICGKLPKKCALFWDGDHQPGNRMNVEDFKAMLAQIKAKKLWYYANWPQCAHGFWAANYGASHHHDFGTGAVVELVTVSTETVPNYFPSSFITMADRLWNADDYNPERSLARATKELFEPDSYPAFYALFKYLDSISPAPEIRTAGLMYVAAEPAARREIIRTQAKRLEELLTACRAAPAAKDEQVKKMLDGIGGSPERTETMFKNLARDEERYAKGMPYRKLAVPLVAEEPKLDGKLDDAVWQKTAVADRLTDFQGSNMAPHQTTVKIVRTKDKLCFAVTCNEPHIKNAEFIDLGLNYPIPIEPKMAGFLWWNEEIELFLDPGRDRKDFYQIILNPWGLKECFKCDGDKYGWHALVYHDMPNIPIEGMVNKLDDAWTLEFAIPSSFFAPEKPEGVWGFNVTRTRRLRIGDGILYSTWTPMDWGFQDSRNFGEMTFPDK